MATIEKRTTQKGTHYRVKIRVKNYPAVTATFEKLAEAKRFATKTESEMRENRYQGHLPAHRYTFAQLVQRYLQEILPFRRDPTQVLILKWWEKQLGHYLLYQMDKALILEYRQKLLHEKNARGQTRSPATVNRYFARLQGLFNHAQREYCWLEINPTHGIRRLPEAQGRTRFLSEREYQQVVEYCAQQARPAFRLAVIMSLVTGMRQGELLQLTWKNIDFKNRCLYLEQTKNNQKRTIPLVEPIFSLLQMHAKVRSLQTVLVFPSPRNPLRPLNLESEWKKLRDTLQLEDFRWHDLRHTAASYLIMSGTDLRTVAEILGHQTLEMTKRYSHLSIQHTTQALERLAATFARLEDAS